MPETPIESLLQYHETPASDDFADQVMRRVTRHQRMRRWILWGAGVVGAGFGTAGVLTLSEPLARLLGEAGPLPVSLALVAGAGLLLWLFSDEAAATG